MATSTTKHSVFVPANWSRGARLGGRPVMNLEGAYADGFHDAAEIVAKQALAGHYPDWLIYPLCFLYRHAIEVALKDAIRRADTLIVTRAYLEEDLVVHARSEHEVDADLERTHSLEALLQKLESRLLIAIPAASLPESVRSAVIELHNRDTKGEAFRYARIRGTGSPRFEDEETVCIATIASKLSDAFKFLSWGVSAALSADTDAINEYVAEYERACQ